MSAIEYCITTNLQEFQLVHFRGVVRSAVVVCPETGAHAHTSSRFRGNPQSGVSGAHNSDPKKTPLECTFTLVDSNGGVSVNVLLAHVVTELSMNRHDMRRPRGWQFRLQSDSAAQLPVPQPEDVVDMTHMRVCRRRHTHALELHATTFTKCAILPEEHPMARHLRVMCREGHAHARRQHAHAGTSTDAGVAHNAPISLRALTVVPDSGIFSTRVQVLAVQFGDHVVITKNVESNQLVAYRVREGVAPSQRPQCLANTNMDIAVLLQSEVLFPACIVCHKELKTSADGVAMPFSCGGSACFQTVGRVLTCVSTVPMRLTVAPPPTIACPPPTKRATRDNMVLHLTGQRGCADVSPRSLRQGCARTWECLHAVLQEIHGTEVAQETTTPHQRYELNGANIVRACGELLLVPCKVATVSCAVVRDANGFEQHRTCSLVDVRAHAPSTTPATQHREGAS